MKYEITIGITRAVHKVPVNKVYSPAHIGATYTCPGHFQ